MMDLKIFQEYVDIYSADLSKWPVDLVKPALSFMDDNEKAKKYFDDLIDIENAMRDIPVPHVNTDDLIANVMTRVGETEQEGAKPVNTPAPHILNKIVGRTAMLPWTGGMMAMALVGFLIGAQPQMTQNSLIDPVFYGADQMMMDDMTLYEGGIF